MRQRRANSAPSEVGFDTVARRSSLSIAAGTVFGGRYTIGALLGRGGMGAVYEATNARGEVVALKTIELDEADASRESEARARFEREIAAATKLDHPNVLGVHDAGVDCVTGAPFLVMPKVSGEDLGAVLARLGVLDPRVAVPLVVQACRGIAAGHAQGIVHRDVTPSNLFLEEEADGRLVVKVADFGLAKLDEKRNEALTVSGALLGTMHYMAPEQAEAAKRVDPRADVFSLGMVLYRALSGRVAFAQPGAFLAFLVGQRAVPHVQEAAPWLSERLTRVVHAALLRAPEARWPTVGEFELGLAMALGFDVVNAPVTRASLETVSEQARQERAPRAVLPEQWEDLLRA